MGFLKALIFLSAISRSFSAPAARKKLVTFDEAFSRNFSVSRTSLSWIPADEDGTYVVDDPSDGSIIFANIVSGTNTTFVKASDVVVDGKPLEFTSYSLQASRDHVLFQANWTKQYRYSGFADYYVFDVEAKTTVPLVSDQAGDIQYATWSPANDTIAFVRGNDLYIWKAGNITRVTEDGGPDVFNGVPDWVYEEEIFGTDYALWFSPDGQYLSFLRFNETGVPTFTIPYYMAGLDVGPTYPRELDLRYPKVGETNPTVQLYLYNIQTSQRTLVQHQSFDPTDLIVTEVAWVTDNHANLIFRTMNRVQNREKLILLDVVAGSTKVVREREALDGWIDNFMAISYVSGLEKPSYIDQHDASGWTRLYLYEIDGAQPSVNLTSGQWEVISALKVDAKRGLVYYISSERNSIERHLYSVGLNGQNKTALVDVQQPGWWTASFSDGAGYYLLSYNGPQVPWQRLYEVPANGTTHNPLQTITTNDALKAKLSEYDLPERRYTTINHPDGYSFNVMEQLPARFDSKKKYPVLFDIYGGPGSQQVTRAFPTVNYRTYLGSDPELQYIILTVDNRGTGRKGRAFMTTVNRQLGKLEAQDQVYAAREWARKPYVDAEHIGIWGWSYGGYLAAKVMETNSDAFSWAGITAPVSDWRFYDTMYTERFMGTLEENAAGYAASAVRNTTGFNNARGGFLIQHGTGDDNVHFQHAAVLVDTLTVGQVSPEKMHVQWFTDSDHSINFHGATGFLYRQLTEALYEEKNRKKGRPPSHQWD